MFDSYPVERKIPRLQKSLYVLIVYCALNEGEFAEMLGVSRPTLSKMINKKMSIQQYYAVMFLLKNVLLKDDDYGVYIVKKLVENESVADEERDRILYLLKDRIQAQGKKLGNKEICKSISWVF